MKWVDYREKLGLGFNDEDKFQMLKNKINLYIDKLSNFAESYEIRSKDVFIENSLYYYFDMIGEKPIYDNLNFHGVKYSFNQAESITELISKYVAFINTSKKFFKLKEFRTAITDALTSILDDLNIQIDILKDKDGVFIFPKGAKELDDALVSEPLEWLEAYPKAHKTYCIALKQYTEGEYIRDTADNLRKALEEFLQEFLGNEKNLETNKTEICKYLGNQGVDAGITGLFQPLINSYKNINDRMVKHNDKVDKKLLEFLLYQTGVLIRMVLSVQQEEE